MNDEFSIVPEFAPQKAVWIQWPTPSIKEGVDERDFIPAFLELERACRTEGEVHNIVLDHDSELIVRNKLKGAKIPQNNIFFHAMPYDSCWSRDNGPIFVRKNGQEHILDFGFNSWGYPPWGPFEKDNEIPKMVAKLLGIEYTQVKFPDNENNNREKPLIYEGGAFEFSGEGTVVASWAICKHRNPTITKAQATDIFKHYFGAHTVIWIDSIISGTTPQKADNHTDGYIKFYSENKVCVLGSEIEGPGKEAATKLEKVGWDIFELPQDFRWTLVNCLIFNGKIIAGFENTPMIPLEEEIMKELFPGKTIVQIEISHLVRGGGGIHCITQQQPR